MRARVERSVRGRLGNLGVQVGRWTEVGSERIHPVKALAIPSIHLDARGSRFKLFVRACLQPNHVRKLLERCVGFLPLPI